MTTTVVDETLQDLHGFPEIDYSTDSQEPEQDQQLQQQIEEVAIEIEEAIEEWDDYIENEMPDFESRDSVTSPTVKDLIQKHKNG